MNKLKKLFGIKIDDFELRFSKSLDQWEVIRDARIMYMGTKENCQRFMKNMSI